MEVEQAVSSLLVELSDIDVTRDINCQGPLTEHVVNQEDGLETKLSAKVREDRRLFNLMLILAL